MAGQRTIFLDHLTVAHAAPRTLIAAAKAGGFDGVGLFLHGMAEVVGMAEFDLVRDAAARREVRDAARDAGQAIAICYPFTLARNSAADDFLSGLDAAAELGAARINLLVYDRDPARAAEATMRLCDDAAARGLGVAVEFFPPSAIATIESAVALCEAVGAENLGLTVDLLHLNRSGGTLEQVRSHRHLIRLAQICDARRAAPDDLFHEAAADRMLPGDGALDPLRFLEACGPDVPASIEAPDFRAIGSDPMQRARDARRALDATQDIIGGIDGPSAATDAGLSRRTA